MNVTENERRSYTFHCHKLLDFNNPCAAEFFLSEDHHFNEYKSAQKGYFDESLNSSDIDILKAH